MGYNLYITRGTWYDPDKPRIGPQEWISVARADPELSLESDTASEQSPEDGVDEDTVMLARWCSSDEDATFVYSRRAGTIRVKGPGDETIRKMIQLAEKLGAFVQGEEEEHYRLGGGGVEHYREGPPDHGSNDP